MASLTTFVTSSVLRSAKGSALSHNELDDNLARCQSNFAVANSNQVNVNSELFTRAWATFQGCNGAVLAHYNVSSVTFVATGNYAVQFSAALVSSVFAVLATAKMLSGGVPVIATESGSSAARTNSGFGLFTASYQGSLYAPPVIHFEVKL